MNGCRLFEWTLRGLVFFAVLLLFLISPAHAQVKGIVTLKDFTGARANASAAGALSATVQASTVGVVATVAGDTYKAGYAFKSADQCLQAAEKSLDFTEKATKAAEAGNLVQVPIGAESAEFFETKTEELAGGVSTVPADEPKLLILLKRRMNS
jgi:hypothetical protein